MSKFRSRRQCFAVDGGTSRLSCDESHKIRNVQCDAKILHSQRKDTAVLPQEMMLGKNEEATKDHAYSKKIRTAAGLRWLECWEHGRQFFKIGE